MKDHDHPHDGDGGEQGGQHANPQGHRKTPDRTRAEQEQEGHRDQMGYVGVDDRRIGTVEAGIKRRAELKAAE